MCAWEREFCFCFYESHGNSFWATDGNGNGNNDLTVYVGSFNVRIVIAAHECGFAMHLAASVFLFRLNL